MVYKGSVTYKQKGVGIVTVNRNNVLLSDIHKSLLNQIEDNTIREFRKTLLMECIKDINLHQICLEGKDRKNYIHYDKHVHRLEESTKAYDKQIKYLKEYNFRKRLEE